MQKLKLNLLVVLASITLLVSIPTLAGHHKYSKKQDIVDIAASADAFTTLVAAVQAAGLVDVLKDRGPYTVFAPTNEAFAKLPEATLNNLLLPENKDKLVQILTYHVVPGKVLAKDVVNLVSAETVQGSNVMVTTNHGMVMIDDANVIQADIKAKNGVIHVIDKVILPSS